MNYPDRRSVSPVVVILINVMLWGVIAFGMAQAWRQFRLHSSVDDWLDATSRQSLQTKLLIDQAKRRRASTPTIVLTLVLILWAAAGLVFCILISGEYWQTWTLTWAATLVLSLAVLYFVIRRGWRYALRPDRGMAVVDLLVAMLPLLLGFFLWIEILALLWLSSAWGTAVDGQSWLTEERDGVATALFVGIMLAGVLLLLVWVIGLLGAARVGPARGLAQPVVDAYMKVGGNTPWSRQDRADKTGGLGPMPPCPPRTIAEHRSGRWASRAWLIACFAFGFSSGALLLAHEVMSGNGPWWWLLAAGVAALLPPICALMSVLDPQRPSAVVSVVPWLAVLILPAIGISILLVKTHHPVLFGLVMVLWLAGIIALWRAFGPPWPDRDKKHKSSSMIGFHLATIARLARSAADPDAPASRQRRTCKEPACRNYSGVDLFRSDNSAVIIHVPHAGLAWPNDGLPRPRRRILETERRLMADLAVDRIADRANQLLAIGSHPQANRFANPWSRLAMDPERFDDDTEEMNKVGMGVIYTHTHDGKPLYDKDLNPAQIELRKHYWYHPYGQAFAALTNEVLNKHDRCLIIDLHSYSTKPLPCEQHADHDRPEVCLGYEPCHDPGVDWIEPIWREAGFETALNEPYSGSYVPTGLWQEDARVSSLMVEVRKDAYLKGDATTATVVPDRVEAIAQVIAEVIRRWSRLDPIAHPRTAAPTAMSAEAAVAGCRTLLSRLACRMRGKNRIPRVDSADQLAS
ncbi:MAG: N-formylglutamate amidohydrolase [Propionibacteriaceae bacterium]|nr:N-formylglutamate amidohydrolase [Propionibacteriaceae bacterium]